MTHDSRPFLSIIAWPQGLDREQTARVAADAAGLDRATVRLHLGRRPPMILAQIEADAAARAVAAIVTRGGEAFAPTLDDIAGLGPTLKIRDLRIEAGVIVVDLWHGPTRTIRREDVQILVRAHLVRNVSSHAPAGVDHGRGASAVARGLRMGYALGAVPAAAFSVTSETTPQSRQLQTSDKLDMHTTDESVFQIDGDKFGYSILGDLRGHSDRHNMDQMFELLAHLAPDEIVDPYYKLWTPPAGHHRLRLPDMKINNDDPAFAFYSRWVALMYRHLLA